MLDPNLKIGKKRIKKGRNDK